MNLLPRVAAGMRRQGGPEGLRALCGDSTIGPRHVMTLGRLLSEQAMTVTELAGHLDASLAATSLMVSDLDAAGLVERHTDSTDRRRTIVSVTPEVRAALEPWYARKAETFARALARLDASERAGLLAGLAAIADELHAEPTA